MYKALFILISLLISNVLQAQRGVVSGILHDSDGSPLPGVSIVIKGTSQGTITDLEGIYRLECAAGDVLIFSSIGFTAKEITVTENMFNQRTNSANEKPVNNLNVASKSPVYNTIINDQKPVVIKQIPVNPIISQAYSGQIIKNKSDSIQAVDLFYTKYSWKYFDYNTLDNFSYRKIKERGNIIEFVPLINRIRYEIEVSSSIARRNVLHLPHLQTDYAQGRPYLGENTWFGPDSNEVFAWGPKISNLVFDGSTYPYDNNGRLVAKNAINTTPAKIYNPYDIFQTGWLYKNSFNIRFVRMESFLKLSYTKSNENGILSAMNINSDVLGLDLKIKKRRHTTEAGINYIKINNRFPNNNLLWTNTLASIELTPPTFDNGQGFVFSNSEQRSAAPEFRNNPYFILNENLDNKKSSILRSNFSYDYHLDQFSFLFSTDYSKSSSNEIFVTKQNTVSFINSYQQIENTNNSALNVAINASYRPIYDLNLSTQVTYNNQSLNFTRQSEGIDIPEINLSRNTVNWVQSFQYYPEHLKINFRNNVYFADGKKECFLPSIGLKYDFSDLLNIDFIHNLSLRTVYTRSVAEPPIYHTDKSYQTLLIDLHQTNGFFENNELFYNKNLDFEIRQTWVIGIYAFGLNGRLNAGINYSNALSKNSIFPILHGNSFELENVAKIKSDSWDFSIESTNINNYNNFVWQSTFNFSKTNSKVSDLYNGYDQIPIAGFQLVSKNLIVNQPVGVIVGSVYMRNEDGRLIIGPDGFPLVSENKEIIGNPNPDFNLSLENKFSIKEFNFSILVDYQKGGDIWNGTKNTLSYYGLSAITANARTTTNYIFEGVTEDGLVNTIPVDFANPANGLTGNRWYKYGVGGVAEDAIEDGSFIRIKEIMLSYRPRIRSLRFFREICINLYAHNLWVITKYSGASPLSWFNDYTQGQGLDYFNMPGTREFGMGISVKI